MTKISFLQQPTNPDPPSIGRRLLFAKSDGWYEEDSDGHVIKIDATLVSELADVVIDAGTLVNGQTFAWDATTSKWKPGPRVMAMRNIYLTTNFK